MRKAWQSIGSHFPIQVKRALTHKKGRSVVHSIGENGGIEVEEEEEERAFEFRPKKEEGTLLDCIEGKGGGEKIGRRRKSRPQLGRDSPRYNTL